jgi:hypothetical protein
MSDDEERKDVTIGVPAADAGGDPPDDDEADDENDE